MAEVYDAGVARGGFARKLAILWSLYFVQGLPFGFQATALPVYLRAAGVSLAGVGFATALALPWSLKIFGAPFVDRFGSARFGPRRSWIVPLQLGLLACCAVAALVPPERGLAPHPLARPRHEPVRRHHGRRRRRARRRPARAARAGAGQHRAGRGLQGRDAHRRRPPGVGERQHRLGRPLRRHGGARRPLLRRSPCSGTSAGCRAPPVSRRSCTRGSPTCWPCYGAAFRPAAGCGCCSSSAPTSWARPWPTSCSSPSSYDAGFAAEQIGLWVGTWGMLLLDRRLGRRRPARQPRAAAARGRHRREPARRRRRRGVVAVAGRRRRRRA